MGILDFFRRKKKEKPLVNIDSDAEVNISIVPKNAGKVTRKPVRNDSKPKKSTRKKVKMSRVKQKRKKK